MRASLVPHATIRLDLKVRHWRLAEGRDAFSGTGLSDPTGDSGRDLGTDLELRLREHRMLALQNAWIIAKGGTPIAEASMAKISGTELRARLANLAMDLLGRAGGLSAEAGERAPFGGRAEFTYRLSPIFRFGGGTNEVMRDIVAAAGLGLPR